MSKQGSEQTNFTTKNVRNLNFAFIIQKGLGTRMYKPLKASYCDLNVSHTTDSSTS